MSLENVPEDSADVVDVEPLVLPPGSIFDDFPEPEPVRPAPKPARKTAEKKPLVGAPKSQGPAATTKPPTVEEWQSFFGRIVIRGVTSGYLWLVLRDIEMELTPEERAYIALEPDELMELAAPFASMSVKSKFLSKHGRAIVSFADSYESFVGLWFWMRRVNKVAKKYRKPAPVQGYVVSEEEMRNGTVGPNDGNVPQYPGQFFSPGSGA